MKIEAGMKLGTYEIFASIGTGDMGEVYRAGHVPQQISRIVIAATS